MFVPMKHLPDSNFWIQEVLHVILNENKIGFIFVFIEILAKFVEKLKNWCWYILEAPFSAAQPWVWPHLYRLHTREFGFSWSCWQILWSFVKLHGRQLSFSRHPVVVGDKICYRDKNHYFVPGCKHYPQKWVNFLS